MQVVSRRDKVDCWNTIVTDGYDFLNKKRREAVIGVVSLNTAVSMLF